jgi:hypothetical protein
MKIETFLHDSELSEFRALVAQAGAAGEQAIKLAPGYDPAIGPKLAPLRFASDQLTEESLDVLFDLQCGLRTYSPESEAHHPSGRS